MLIGISVSMHFFFVKTQYKNLESCAEIACKLQRIVHLFIFGVLCNFGFTRINQKHSKVQIRDPTRRCWDTATNRKSHGKLHKKRNWLSSERWTIWRIFCSIVNRNISSQLSQKKSLKWKSALVLVPPLL